MEEEITLIYNDIELVILGVFNKGQNGSYDYPGYASYFDCYKVLCRGQNIIDILEQNIIEDLEEEANQIIQDL